MNAAAMPTAEENGLPVELFLEFESLQRSYIQVVKAMIYREILDLQCEIQLSRMLRNMTVAMNMDMKDRLRKLWRSLEDMDINTDAKNYSSAFKKLDVEPATLQQLLAKISTFQQTIATYRQECREQAGKVEDDVNERLERSHGCVLRLNEMVEILTKRLQSFGVAASEHPDISSPSDVRNVP